jgi:hypothetical protein
LKRLCSFRRTHGEPSVITKPTTGETIASITLAEHGITAIWDLHVAAAAAFGLGRFSVAATLIEVADAVELEWLRRCGPEARAG